MATTEGTLVASYSRGMRLTREAGGVQTTVIKDSMQRAPVFVFSSARAARNFGDWVTENAGSSAVVQSVGANLAGIGYSGIGYRTPNVKPLKLAIEKGGEFVAAEAKNAYDGSYPLARPLYLAINYDARKPLDPLRAEFVRYIFSKQGQVQVAKDGYLPLDAEAAAEALATVGLK